MLLWYCVTALIGVVLMVIGFGVVANEVVYHDQAPGIILAVLGLIITNAAGESLLTVGRRVVARRRVNVLGSVPQIGPTATTMTPTAAALVAGDGLRHYHRADCPMASDRDWKILDRAAHESAGRKPCGACSP